MNPEENKYSIDRLAIRATRWIGSPTSLVVHTILFISSFVLIFTGIPADKILLVLTTLVSLEAIYLSIFIQMSVNRSNQRLQRVRQNIEEIQSNVEEIQEDVEGIEKDIDEIQEDVEEIQEDVEGIEKDVDEIQVDVDEIQKDVEEIQEDVEEIEKDVDEIQEDSEADEASERARDQEMLVRVEGALEVLMKELSELKKVQNASVAKREKVVKKSK